MQIKQMRLITADCLKTDIKIKMRQRSYTFFFSVHSLSCSDCWLNTILIPDDNDDGDDSFCYETDLLKAKSPLDWTGFCFFGPGRQFSTGEDGLVKEPWPEEWAD